MSIKWEVGKKYVNRNGDVVECFGMDGSIVGFTYLDKMSSYYVYEDGRLHISVIHGLDIIAEYEPKEEPNSKPTTVGQWRCTLPTEYADLAFENVSDQNKRAVLKEDCESLQKAIFGAFSFHRAKFPICGKDGIDFWCGVANGERPQIPVKRQAEIENAKQKASQTNDKYNRMIKDRTGKELGIVDVYCVGDAFDVSSIPLNHAIKKILCAGTRGKGDEVQDLTEAIQAIQRRLMEITK
jgi:hypothetical protein